MGSTLCQNQGSPALHYRTGRSKALHKFLPLRGELGDENPASSLQKSRWRLPRDQHLQWEMASVLELAMEILEAIRTSRQLHL